MTNAPAGAGGQAGVRRASTSARPAATSRRACRRRARGRRAGRARARRPPGAAAPCWRARSRRRGPAAASRTTASTCPCAPRRAARTRPRAQIAQHEVEQPVRVRVQHPRVARQRLDAHRRLRRRRRRAGARRWRRTPRGPSATAGPRQASRRRPDRDVADAAVDRGLRELAVGELVQAHRDAGMRLAQPLDRVRQQADGQRQHGRDLDLRRLQPERATRRARPALGRQHRGLRLRQQRAAGRREARAARQALEQRPADLVLQQADLLRQRGRRDVDALGAGAERAGLGDRDEVLQLAEVHAAPQLGIA